MADRGEHAVGKVSDSVSQLYANSTSRARDVFDEMPASVSDAAATAERAVLKGRQRLDRGVRNQPVEALLLAGAIGYLVGWATSRS